MRTGHDWVCTLSVAGLVLALGLFGGWINPYRERVQEGNEKYKESKYEDALKIYADAAATFDPESRELHFNIGDSWYKQKDYVKAIEEFGRVIGSEDPLLEAKAHYNIGNASFEQGDYVGAIEEYVRSLKLNSKDEDAKYNLEVARKKLKEQLDKMKDQAQPQPESQQQDQRQGGQGDQQEDQQQQPEEEKSGDEEEEKQKEPQEQEDQAQQQEQQQVRLTREEAERLLDRLQEDEQEQRRERLRRPTSDTYSVEKDW